MFYVVQFIELPFEDINNNVCVPYSWIILQKSSNRKTVVTYPINEDPLETRERVRRKERPNDSWGFYMAYVKYESEEFEDADLWIARNEYGTDEKDSKQKHTKPEPQLNQVRSVNQSCWSESNLGKLQLTVKPSNNPRKPLPRISILQPLSQKVNQKLNNKRWKLNENPKPVVITDHITTASGSSKQEQSIIITGNQAIQKDQTKTNYASSNGEMNTEQSTQPKVVKNNQSVDLSVQSTSAKLPVEYQLSPQSPTEQQLSLQPPIGREPSPQPPIDRQPLMKFIAEQYPSSKFLDEQQTPPVGQDYQQPVSMSAVDLDNFKGDIDSCQNVLPEPFTDEIPLTKTPLSAFKPAPQPDLMNERPIALLRHEHSLLEPPSRDVSTGQSQEPNDCQKTQAPRSSTTTNPLFQQYGYAQLPIFSVNNTLNSKFQPQGFGERNSIEVADNHSVLHFQDINDSMPSNSYQQTSEKLTQMLKLKARQQSSAVKKVKSRVDKKTRLERITTNIATPQYPPNSMRQLGLPDSSTFTQSAQFSQLHLQQAQIDGSLINDDRRGMRENFISQRDPRAQGMMNIPATQSLSKLAHQYNAFLETSHEQQNLPTRENYLQQFTHLQDKPTMTPTLDQKVYHRNSITNGGFIIQSQPNPINQPIQFLPQNVNPYIPVNSAYLGTSHEQQYLSTREDYVQHITRLQDMLRRPTMIPTLDQKVYHQNAMLHGGFVVQSQPTRINQPTQFLPQNINQYVPINSAYPQEVKSHELIKRYTDGAHVTYKPVALKKVNIQFPTHYSSSQLHRNSEHPQKKQDQQNYRDPRATNTQNGLPFKSTRSSVSLKPPKVTKRSRSLFNSKTPIQALLDAQRSCLIRELNIQERVNQSSTKSSNTNIAAISETPTEKLACSVKNTDVQTMPSSNQVQATQCTLVQNEHNQLCPGMKKTMIDQGTEMDVSHYVKAIAGSSLRESASRAVESVCQTDEWLEKEKDSLSSLTSSDSENATDNEIQSENEVVPEANQINLTAKQNLTQENHHEQSRIMFDVIGTLLAQMEANLSSTRDMYECLQNSHLVCAQTYTTLLEKFNKLTSIHSLQNSASPPNNLISQVTQGIPAGDNDNTTSVGNATTSIREQRGSFSLPAEYDPNDTKWTLKYRENKPILVELIPRTGVYVKRQKLKRCIRESNDCNTLARLLLTEVFSHNALSVCSWTGGKEKAFNFMNIDVRPGLDENARMVLLTFVEKHGKKRGWSMASTSAVMSTILNTINDIRAKHEQTCNASGREFMLKKRD